MSNFTKQNATFEVDTSKKVIQMKVKLKIKDCTGTVGVTDVMLQRGVISTEWAAHPAEIKWTANE